MLQNLEYELMMRKRVPVSASMSRLVSMDVASPKSSKKSAPNAKLRRVLASKRTEWHTIRKMASKMLDKNYTLSQFMQDLAAFPELSLYLRDGVMETGSGRTTDDEYQRTVCAFFAIYWLMRLDIDGRQGFCFGTDECWNSLKENMVKDGQVAMQSGSAPTELQKRLYQPERRLAFLNNAQWSFFRRLMVDAESRQKQLSQAHAKDETANCKDLTEDDGAHNSKKALREAPWPSEDRSNAYTKSNLEARILSNAALATAMLGKHRDPSY